MTKKEKEHLKKVAEIGCVACRILGYYNTPAEIPHIKGKNMMGKKSSHFETIPLCPYHHRTSNESYHHSPKSFTEKFGTQEYLLEYTREILKWHRK